MRSNRRVPAGALICLALLGALAVAAQRADAVWSPHTNLARGEGVAGSDLAMNPSGEVVFVWRREWGLQTRERSADGTLTPVQQVAPRSSVGSYSDVAIDPAGNAVFAWQATDNGYFSVKERVRHADGTLGPTRILAAAHGGYPVWLGDVQVGVDDTGRTVFAWTRRLKDGTMLFQTRSRSAGGDLSHAINVGGGDFGERMAVAANGEAIFVWKPDVGHGILARTMAADDELEPTQRISASGSNPEVAVNPAGRAVFVWNDAPDGNPVVVARVRSVNGTLDPTQLIGMGELTTTPLKSSAAVAPNGTAVFCWTRFSHGGAGLARTRTPSGTLLPVETIYASGAASHCETGVDSNGDLTFSWTVFLDGKNRAFTRSAPAGEPLGPAHPLSPAGYNASAPALAVNSAGNAAATWDLGHYGFAIQAAFGP